MSVNYIRKLNLKIQKPNIRIQKIDNITLKTFKIVIINV